MDIDLHKQNRMTYEIVRANILAAVKGSYFMDCPNYVVHKIDEFYTRSHNREYPDFLKAFVEKIQEMKSDFTLGIEEFKRVSTSLESMEKYLNYKINGDIE